MRSIALTTIAVIVGLTGVALTSSPASAATLTQSVDVAIDEEDSGIYFEQAYEFNRFDTALGTLQSAQLAWDLGPLAPSPEPLAQSP